ncbi:tumor necrosis factor receptor superfamily member 6-like, partial [Stylophora pistillata]|uniref:tumor necrosis factor receptor superfamily member 6-like n=1 Tax=Stylophora pistillata TaxID=50429 RepID=UPI000C051E6D
VILVMVLWSQFVIGGPIRCSLVRNFLIYYPDDPGAEMECKACPECPLGLGLVPQCGTKITNYTTIKCEPCQQNKTYSDKHGIESCRSCHDCGLTNVIQQCTPSQNRKCGTECPERHYLDDNGFCQECYFCCPSVDETGRMKKCNL